MIRKWLKRWLDITELEEKRYDVDVEICHELLVLRVMIENLEKKIEAIPQKGKHEKTKKS